MFVWEILTALTDKINARPLGIQLFQAVYHFYVSGDDGGKYQVTFADGHVSLVKGTPDEATCILELSDSNFIKWVQGTLNPTAALVKGSLKIKGDIGHSIKLQTILYQYQS